MNRRIALPIAAIALLSTVVTCKDQGPDPKVAVASVTVSPSSATILVGETQQYSATVRDGDGNELLDRTVTWSTSSPETATVRQTGLAKGLAPGTTYQAMP